MSMIACPGCGLPREEDQLASVPCPICAVSPATAVVAEPVAKKPVAHDPTTGLPADVGEMQRFARQEGFPAWFNWAAVFLLGVATGVGGLYGWQASKSRLQPTETVKADPRRELPPLPPKPSKRGVESAPMPHEPQAVAVPEPEPEPLPPEPKEKQPAPERVVVIDLNLPNHSYSIPFAMKKGERIILRGKVKTLKATGLDAGALLDASGLEAAEIYIGGKIDGASVLKLNAPNGKVTFAASVIGKSSVEIIAPGGDVTFSAPTTPNRPGSTIDGGSTVAITARTAELRGDINGSNTKVTVNLPRIGSLKVVAIRGTAVVGYRVPEGKGMPDVSAAFVSPAASFKKID